MKLTKITQVQAFLAAVDKCKGNVWLTSEDGDKFNLKSKISQFIAMGALLGVHGDEMELWCEFKEDEVFFFDYFNHYPEILK